MFQYICVYCVLYLFVIVLFVWSLCFVGPVSVCSSSSSAKPWMDSLDSETLYVSPEQTGQPTPPLSNPEVSSMALGG